MWVRERKELIDTLWNVNEERNSIWNTKDFELIDTLWNVNYIGGDFYKINKDGINRYIMECKSYFPAKLAKALSQN